MTEPVELDDLKTHLRLSLSSTEEDAYLDILLMAARRACEFGINRSIVGKPATLALDRFPAYPLWTQLARECAIELAIDLPGGVASSVTSITYFSVDGAPIVLDPSAYVVDLSGSRVAPVSIWPIAAHRPAAVTIAYVLSPLAADDLAVVQQAILLLVGNWYENREGAVVDTRGTPTELPLAVTWLLQPLRRFATS